MVQHPFKHWNYGVESFVGPLFCVALRVPYDYQVHVYVP